LIRLFILSLLIFLLAGCAPLWKEKGYESEASFNFASSIGNAPPEKVIALESWGIKSKSDLDKLVKEYKASNYANDESYDTIFAYLRDRYYGEKIKLTPIEYKNKRIAEAALTDKERIEKIKKKTNQSQLLISKKSNNEILIVDSSDIKAGSDSNKDTIGFLVQIQYKNPVNIQGYIVNYIVANGYLYCSDGSGRFNSYEAFNGIDSSSPKVVSNTNLDQKIGANGSSQFMSSELKEMICSDARKKNLIITAADIKSTKDLPNGKEFYYKDLPSKIKSEVCVNVESVNRDYLGVVIETSWDRYSPKDSYIYAQIFKNGDGGWTGTAVSGDSCNVNVSVSGIYKGNSYSAKLSCPVQKFSKKANGKFYVGSLDTCR
jgi:hypothetical protein